ncbi:BQ2448_79 [Microbotryum intermedium]|uniref:BQ2448_79 protein n=1 Tax=Microbotryum intermedium TaxID=269621 RepID=A0A238FA07_9BASI|nr:BQ2448_79 [Microbotryum intermedium]
MAKAKSRLLTVRLLSTACNSVGTGFSYIAKRPRTAEKKLAFMKYDPKAGKHVLFMEAKLK